MYNFKKELKNCIFAIKNKPKKVNWCFYNSYNQKILFG